MHGTFDRSGESRNRFDRSWNVGLFAVPALLAIALVGLAMTQPAASNWISEAAQAEFAGAFMAPEMRKWRVKARVSTPSMAMILFSFK